MWGLMLALVIGVVIGFMIAGVVSRNSVEEDIQAAYERGKRDENERVRGIVRDFAAAQSSKKDQI